MRVREFILLLLAGIGAVGTVVGACIAVVHFAHEPLFDRPFQPAPLVKPDTPPPSQDTEKHRHPHILPWRNEVHEDMAPERIGEKAVVGGPVSPDGTEEIVCDLPDKLHIKNVGGRDGAGLCVFTSINMAGWWQHEKELYDFQKHMRQEPGGGYPEKVDVMMKKYAPHVQYIQSTAGDPQVLKLAIKTGRFCNVTYGYSERYGGPIAHMVNLVHFSDRWAAVLDNNFPGSYEWMTPAEFVRRWKMGGGGGWVVVLLSYSPPPIPRNVAADGWDYEDSIADDHLPEPHPEPHPGPHPHPEPPFIPIPIEPHRPHEPFIPIPVPVEPRREPHHPEPCPAPEPDHDTSHNHTATIVAVVVAGGLILLFLVVVVVIIAVVAISKSRKVE